jgi:CRISPR-associated protein Cas2
MHSFAFNIQPTKVRSPIARSPPKFKAWIAVPTFLLIQVVLMRRIYLVTYDICDDKRLRRVYKTMRNWGDHLQYSVFECQLGPTDLITLKSLLRDIVNHSVDQILFIDLGPAAGRGERLVEAIGQPYTKFDAPCLVL